MFSQPEEKLWLVVQDYSGALDADLEKPGQGLTRGFKLEKNSVIKLGRVRLRVRDIDYAEDLPFRQSKIEEVKDQNQPRPKKDQSNPNNSESVLDINEIQLIEEAQN